MTQVVREEAVLRRRLPRQQRVEQLLDAAEQVFFDVGFDGASIGDIARAAGVTRPVVYEHFKDKPGIYLACVRRARGRFHERMVAAVSAVDEPFEQLRSGSDAYFQMLEDDPRRWELLFAPTALTGGEFAAQLAQERLSTVGLIADLLAVHIPHLPRPRLEVMAHLLSGASEQVGRWWLNSPGHSRQEVLSWYMDLAWAGIGRHVIEPTGAGPAAPEAD